MDIYSVVEENIYFKEKIFTIMEDFSINLSVCYTRADVFKKKFCDITTSIIAGSRMHDMMNFIGYGNMSFDENDHKHLNPIIKLQDKFNRVKTNCLIYDLYDTPFNTGMYDKMILYHEVYGKNGYYNYYIWNSETGEGFHITWIEDAFDNLIQRLSKTFNTLRKTKMFDYYRKHHGPNRRKVETNIPVPTVTDMKEMLEYYDTIDLKYANKL